MRGTAIVCALVGCTSSSQLAGSPPRAAATTVGRAAPAADPLLPAPAYLASTRIAALTDGALVIDADSGMLARTSAEGMAVARLMIGRDAGTLAYDPVRGVAFVADRAGDRILAVAVEPAALRVTAAWKTPAEPFGVALAPDRATLYVTTVADRTLIALDTETGVERWRALLSYQPRAIAVSPDARRALVTAGGDALDEVALGGAHTVTPIELPLDCDHCAIGSAFARGGAVVFLDQYRAIVSFQRAVPQAIDAFSVERYSGSSLPPITQHLDFVSFAPGASSAGQTVAQIAANQPRSILWDRGRDTLWVAGLASDTLLRLPGLTHGTTDDTEAAASGSRFRTGEPCGPDGLAQATDGSVYVWCSFSRRVVHLAAVGDGVDEGTAIAESALSADEHQGFLLFHSVQHAINEDGAMACATCHVDGRSDGRSWKIKDNTLQTPNLAGRLAGTAPYKWDGSDATLADSIASTIHRLGGRGLGPPRTAALIAYLEALPRPHLPTLDAAAVARGKRVFDGAGGCDDCHSGTRLTDNTIHKFAGTALAADTPSLIGLAASAPYFHDGSATTLTALVRGEGSVHGMGKLDVLTGAERADLAAYLASL